MDRNVTRGQLPTPEPPSLSARRAWIEIAYGALDGASEIVALRKESVDRNNALQSRFANNLKSLSARRAWIEIKTRSQPSRPKAVALRKESVDRNSGLKRSIPDADVALRKESVDRNR